MPKQALYPSPLYRFDGKLLTRFLSNRTRALFLALSYHIMELEIHLYRIDDHSNRLSTDASSDDALTTRLELMADVHSYIIAWTNIAKTLKRLAFHVGDPRLIRAYTKREGWFSRMRKARNDLEHLDERVIHESGPRHTPQILYIPSDKVATASILGIRVEIRRRGNDRLLSLLEELDLWLDALPSRFQASRASEQPET